MSTRVLPSLESHGIVNAVRIDWNLTPPAQGKELFVQDCYACADPRYRYPVRIITEHAWHSLFIRNMLLPADPDADPEEHNPALTIR